MLITFFLTFKFLTGRNWRFKTKAPRTSFSQLLGTSRPKMPKILTDFVRMKDHEDRASTWSSVMWSSLGIAIWSLLGNAHHYAGTTVSAARPR